MQYVLPEGGASGGPAISGGVALGANFGGWALPWNFDPGLGVCEACRPLVEPWPLARPRPLEGPEILKNNLILDNR